jgi:hypothetical protein
VAGRLRILPCLLVPAVIGLSAAGCGGSAKHGAAQDRWSAAFRRWTLVSVIGPVAALEYVETPEQVVGSARPRRPNASEQHALAVVIRCRQSLRAVGEAPTQALAAVSRSAGHVCEALRRAAIRLRRNVLDRRGYFEWVRGERQALALTQLIHKTLQG